MIDTDSLAPLILATMCVFALGVSATTLESTVSTDPKELVDLDYGSLPIGQDQAEQIREEVESNERKRRASRPSSSPTDPQNQEKRPGGTDRARAPQQAGGGAVDTGRGPGRGLGDEAESLFEWLLSMLPYVFLLALCVLCYRYRRRLAALLAAAFATDSGASRGERQQVVDLDSSNPVHRAWGELVRSLDLDTPRTKTPREVAGVAIEAGKEPEAVHELTGLFERVRYGDGSLTDDRLARLDDATHELGVRP